MTTVYLHMGMPKCASSALQSFLNMNDARLCVEGLCYPVESREMSGYFSHRPLHRILPEEVPHAIRKIAEEAKSQNCTRLLISSEEFVNSLWDKEITGQIVNALNTQFGTENVRILMLFRNHFSFVESVYAQFLKGGMFRTPDKAFMMSNNNNILGFASNFRLRNGFDFFSYCDFIERLRVHASFNPFDLLSTELADWGGKDIIDVLCDRFGVTRGSAALAANERYSETALHLLHYSRKKYGFVRTKQRRELLADLFPPGQRQFTKLLHVHGELFDRIAEASERDRQYFQRNSTEASQNLFSIPETHRMQRSQDDQLVVPDWCLILADGVMQPADMSPRQARKLKLSLQEQFASEE